MRPLYDDGASSATAATRDYVIKRARKRRRRARRDVFGGKITTYRRLAGGGDDEARGRLPGRGGPWTAGAPLPGGDFPVDGAGRWRAADGGLSVPDAPWAGRLVRGYGTEAAVMLEGARTAAALGERFGWDLTEREVGWLMEREWAQTAEDVLWRRTKLGLRFGEAEVARLGAFMAAAAGTLA